MRTIAYYGSSCEHMIFKLWGRRFYCLIIGARGEAINTFRAIVWWGEREGGG